jgi:hypothetical protein
VALRKLNPVRRRLWVAAVGIGISLLCILHFALVESSAAAGRELHKWLFLIGMYGVMRGPALASGAFARERREGTIGFLFLSGLGAGEVFLGKMLSAAAIAFNDLFAVMPLLALPFLMGGVSFDLFLATVCCLPNLLLFTLAVSLLASVLVSDDGAALVLGWVLVAVLCVIPPLGYLVSRSFAGPAGPSQWWLWLSPACGPIQVLDLFRNSGPADFWRNFSVTLAWSAVSLGVAAVRLGKSWREEEIRVQRASWLDRWTQLQERTSVWRRGLAKYWLEVNPFVWLAARNPRPVRWVWGVIAGTLGLWMVGWVIWGRQWPSVTNFYVTAMLLTMGLRWIIHYTAAASLAGARHDGGYELLLTTPLEPSDMVWGQLEAQKAQFRAPSMFLLATEFVMLVAGLLVRHWDGPSLFVYLAIWSALMAWVWDCARNPRGTLRCMWAGLNCGRPAFAVWKTMGFNWAWLWILYNLYHSNVRVGNFQRFPTGSVVELILAGGGIAILWVCRLRTIDTVEKTEARLVAEFREITREPVPEPTDPRFKKWIVEERFPWGWEMVQQQLHERTVRRHMTDMR